MCALVSKALIFLRRPPQACKKNSAPSPENTEVYKGFDLTLPSGILWSIPIVIVAGRPSLEIVRMKLLENKLFSRSERQECEDILKNADFSRRSNLLRALDETFFIKFGTTSFTVCTTIGI